jgi:ubiquinone/menaquinone biosynthesis C-methylase UbiE
MHKFSVENAQILDSSERASILNPEEILDLVELSENSVVADIGSGTGFFTIPASKRVAKGRVYAIDINDGMHRILDEKLLAEKINNVLSVTSTEETIPIDDSEVDFAYIGNTLHELIGDLTLREILRILKPEGTIFVVDWKKEDSPMGPPLRERLSLNEAKMKLGDVGFTVTSAEDQGPYNYIINAAKSKGI